MYNQSFYIGVDGGGSKTTVVIMDAKGIEQGRGTGGPGNIANLSIDALRHSLLEAYQSACKTAGMPTEFHFTGICAGMAGFSAAAKRSAFLSLLKSEINAGAHSLEPDFVIAYWGATHGEPGIIVIAGTGAVAYGRNAQGQTEREDGLGFLLGDRGSGFNLGLRVLRYTLDEWKQGKSNALTSAVIQYTGASSQEQIVQWLYGEFNPARVASMAPLVGELAQAGDPAARWHVAEMARRLRHSVRQVRHRLWMDRDIGIYPLGGLWNLGSFFREEFMEPKWTGEVDFPIASESLSGGCFLLEQPKSDAAYGAALLAMSHDGLSVNPEKSYL